MEFFPKLFLRINWPGLRIRQQTLLNIDRVVIAANVSTQGTLVHLSKTRCPYDNEITLVSNIIVRPNIAYPLVLIKINICLKNIC